MRKPPRTEVRLRGRIDGIGAAMDVRSKSADKLNQNSSYICQKIAPGGVVGPLVPTAPPLGSFETVTCA